MTKVKEASRGGLVGWCNNTDDAAYMAVGNWAGATTDFSSTANSELEMFSLNLEDSGDEMKSIGKIDTPDKFWRVAWGAYGKGTDGKGIIAGAMTSGRVNLWDAGRIINPAEGESPLIAAMEKHTGSVRCVGFNPFKPNLLGSAGGNGEIFMFDITNPKSPVSFSPGGRSNNCVNIQDFGWSVKFEHILAATSVEGWTNVWDLRQKRVAVEFPNEGKRLSKVLWHPEEAMKVAVACENDDPAQAVIQIWDLRSAFQPLTVLQGHQRGVVSASWCPDDPSLLVSVGRDNKTICWNPETSEILQELPSNWNFDVQWSPSLTGVLSVSARRRRARGDARA